MGFSALLLLALAIAVTPTANAQVLYGSIVGTITDESGASIPGATVGIMNTATGASQEGSTSEDGLYRFINIQAGSYDVTVGSDGFRSYISEGVTVTVNTITRVDVAMQIGQVTEQITVEATAARLQTEKASTSAEITSEAVTSLPLPGFRNYQSLVNLVPGATPARFQNSILDTPARSLSTNINGTNRNNNVTRRWPCS